MGKVHPTLNYNIRSHLNKPVIEAKPSAPY